MKNYFLNNSNNNAISSQLTKNSLTVIDNISKSFLTFIAAICQQGNRVYKNALFGVPSSNTLSRFHFHRRRFSRHHHYCVRAKLPLTSDDTSTAFAHHHPRTVR
jgi:hypothetical protein